MNIAKISVCDAIHFTGDLRPGRFRSIGVVTGIVTHRGIGGEVFVQRLSDMSYHALLLDRFGNIVESDVAWDKDDRPHALGAPASAEDMDVREFVHAMSESKVFKRFDPSIVHPATMRLLGRLDLARVVAPRIS